MCRPLRMSGIIDIRVVTEAPFKLALASGIVFFALASWHMPNSFSTLFSRLPLISSVGLFTQIELLKSVIVALLVWFLLRYKKSWVLSAVSAEAPPPAPISSKQ